MVSAGPSGLTAAIRAAELGVRTTLIEKRKRQPFRFAGCRSRDVEPTLYDWALGHWNQGVFDWTGAPMELRWRAGRADLIALSWQMQLPSILRTHGHLLVIKHGTTAVLGPGGTPPSPHAGQITIDLVQHGTRTTHQFGAMVSCVGWGRERIGAGPSYRGLGFWRTDDFQKPRCGLPTPPRILISGGGDGSLQDFIRVMTLSSIRTVFDAFRSALAPVPWLLDAVAGDIQDAEDVAARAFSWNLPKHDIAVFHRLEQTHERIIGHLRRSPFWGAIRGAIRGLIPSTVPQVHLAHRGTFSPSATR